MNTMHKATLVARIILGVLFLIFGLNFWLKFLPIPPPPEGNASAFLGALYITGYLAFVKALEVAGAIALLAKRTATGLLLLGPVILNIVLYDVFLAQAPNPVVILASVLALFLLYTERQRFLPLLGKGVG